MPEMSYRQLARIAPTTRSVHWILAVAIEKTHPAKNSVQPPSFREDDRYGSFHNWTLRPVIGCRMSTITQRHAGAWRRTAAQTASSFCRRFLVYHCNSFVTLSI